MRKRATNLRKEADVREWVRRNAGKQNCFWVEAGRGSTHGFPDVMPVRDGRQIYLELKFGTIAADGRWSFRYQKAQKVVLRRMKGLGLPVAVMVGVAGGRAVVALIDEEVLSGKVDFERLVGRGRGLFIDLESKETWARLFHFVFRDSEKRT